MFKFVTNEITIVALIVFAVYGTGILLNHILPLTH